MSEVKRRRTHPDDETMHKTLDRILSEQRRNCPIPSPAEATRGDHRLRWDGFVPRHR